MSSNQPVKIYNAAYSGIQVYQCMVRGIAVMRRRSDSYVNATQILKVAGVDEDRRTRILEREVHSGMHEIVTGRYRNFRGTWIPLERGRDLALRYEVAPLLAPLFDFTPSASGLAAPPVSSTSGTASPPPPVSSTGGTASPPPPSPPSSPSNIGSNANNASSPVAPQPIMPDSALLKDVTAIKDENEISPTTRESLAGSSMNFP